MKSIKCTLELILDWANIYSRDLGNGAQKWSSVSLSPFSTFPLIRNTTAYPILIFEGVKIIKSTSEDHSFFNQNAT